MRQKPLPGDLTMGQSRSYNAGDSLLLIIMFLEGDTGEISAARMYAICSDN